jgi:hypothetical protein
MADTSDTTHAPEEQTPAETNPAPAPHDHGDLDGGAQEDGQGHVDEPASAEGGDPGELPNTGGSAFHLLGTLLLLAAAAVTATTRPTPATS